MKDEEGARRRASGRVRATGSCGRAEVVLTRAGRTLLDLLNTRDQDSHQLAGLLPQRHDFLWADYLRSDQQLQPVVGLLEFLETHFNLAYELSRRTAASGLAEVSSHRGPGPQDLLSDDLRRRRPWQGSIEANHGERESPRPLSDVILFPGSTFCRFLFHPSSSLPPSRFILPLSSFILSPHPSSFFFPPPDRNCTPAPMSPSTSQHTIIEP